MATGRADVLVVTATDIESDEALRAFADHLGHRARSVAKTRTYFHVGEVRGTQVFLVQSEQGAGGIGGAAETVRIAIHDLSPAAVIMIGVAFGMNEEAQAIGEVLVSTGLRLYELQRVSPREPSPSITPRGARPDASGGLLAHLRHAAKGWSRSRVHFGVLLTGAKLVDSLDFRDQLQSFEPEAIGGEMEGEGVYVACTAAKVDWILVKAICDWADGHKTVDKDARQRTAAASATQFVLHALAVAPIDWAALRYAARPAVALTATPAGAASSSSLPAQARLYGRDDQLRLIADALAPDSRTWGVLIDGPGGIGKTALAIGAAHAAPDDVFRRKIFLSAKMRELTPDGVNEIPDYLLRNFISMITELGRELELANLEKYEEAERVRDVTRALADAHALLVIDNLETFPEPERRRVYQFLKRLPASCKAIVTSRRSTNSAGDEIRLDRLDRDAAMAWFDRLATRNAVLAATEVGERKAFYEATGGNPLLIEWTVGQLGRRSSQCRTVADACALLGSAPPGNDALAYIFADLLDTFDDGERSVLAALAHFTEATTARTIAEIALIGEPQAQVALDSLADRALLVADSGGQRFYLPPMVATFLRNQLPAVVDQSGERLTSEAIALVEQRGGKRHARFPALESAWPAVAAALDLLARTKDRRLLTMLERLEEFLVCSGRWDERVRRNADGEAVAVAVGDLRAAGWCAYRAGHVHHSRGNSAELGVWAARAAMHWKAGRCGPREEAVAFALRGWACDLADDHEGAIALFGKALDLDRKRSPLENYDVYVDLHDLARAEIRAGRLDDEERDAAWIQQIEGHLREARGLASRLGTPADLASCDLLTTRLALGRRQWQLADELARRTLETSQQIGATSLTARASHDLATVLLQQRRAAEAVPHARRAVDLFTRLALRKEGEQAQALLRSCELEATR